MEETLMPKIPQAKTTIGVRWSLVYCLKKMVFISINEEENMFYDCLAKDLTFWQYLFLTLWSHCVFVHKFREILEILIASWFVKALKIVEPFPPNTLKIEVASIPKTLNQKLLIKIKFVGPSTSNSIY